MTSSIKPEVRNVSHRRLMRTETRPWVTCAKMFRKDRTCCSEDMLADGQTNRQTDTLITVTVEYCTPPDRYPYRGRGGDGVIKQLYTTSSQQTKQPIAYDRSCPSVVITTLCTGIPPTAELRVGTHYPCSRATNGTDDVEPLTRNKTSQVCVQHAIRR